MSPAAKQRRTRHPAPKGDLHAKVGHLCAEFASNGPCLRPNWALQISQGHTSVPWRLVLLGEIIEDPVLVRRQAERCSEHVVSVSGGIRPRQIANANVSQE